MNKNYRIMKFFEPADRMCRGKGYVKIDMRGNRGNITVNVENLGDGKVPSEVYLFKNKDEKIKIGPINSKRGRLQRNIMAKSREEPIENYNICGIVDNGKVVLYTPIFSSSNTKQLNILLGREDKDNVKIEDVKIENTENTSNQRFDNKKHSEESCKKQNKSIIHNEDVDYSVNENSNNNRVNFSRHYINNTNNTNFNDNINDATNKVSNNFNSVNGDVSYNENLANNDNFENDINVNKDNIIIETNNNANSNDINDNYNDNKNNMDKNIEDNSVSKLNAVEKEPGKHSYKNEYEKNLYSLLSTFNKVSPLAHDINSIRWWRVDYDENSIYKGFLPYFNQIISTYYPYPLSNHVTTCQLLMKKHGYYLFGIYEENGKIEKFVYGVPGKFTRDEQPYRGVTGFKNWSYKKNDLDGNYGYWLAFIDANTGAIAEPPNIEG